MRIVIDTDGYTRNTQISINGKALKGIREFNFSMNPHRFRNGGISLQGKCKMQQIFEGDFRSYFAEDFRKMDEVTKGENYGSEGSAGDFKGNRRTSK